MSSLAIRAPRRLSLMLVMALWIAAAAAAALAPRTSYAQEGEKPAAPAEHKEGGEGEHAPKSKIWWFIESSGWIGAIILVLSMYFIATVGRLFVELRPVVTSPPEVIEETEALLEKRDFKGIYALLREDDSAFSKIVSAGLAELSNGLPDAREAMEHVGEVVAVGMERKISMLAVLGTLGPMIGLLGTLKGMIASFSVIALSDTQLKASEVAGGISEALLLTFEGVALSVPAIYFFAVFKNRTSSLTVNTMLEADEFVRRLSNAARGKGAPAGGGAAPAKAAAAPA
jgi:biopolymer transport protein ExbB